MTQPAMILAAGFGTRMGALTRDRPKPLIEVAGRPLLDHALAAARGCQPIVVNAHYRADQISEHLKARHPRVAVSVETPEILDSGGGIKRALPLLGEGPIVSLNADAVWDGPPPVRVVRKAWDETRMSGLMLLVPRDRAIGRQGGGDVAMDEAGRLTWDTSEAGLIFTGAQILVTEALRDHPAERFSMRDIWTDWMAEGRLFGVVYPGRWADVGHPDGITLAEAMIGDG